MTTMTEDMTAEATADEAARPDAYAFINAARCPECSGWGKLAGPRKNLTSLDHSFDCPHKPRAESNLRVHCG